MLVYTKTVDSVKRVYLKKSMLLKLLEVTIYIHVASKSPLEDSLPTMPLGKLNFLQMFFLHVESKVQVNKNNYRTMLFMSKQVRLPKNSSILQKMTVSPKKHYTPF